MFGHWVRSGYKCVCVCKSTCYAFGRSIEHNLRHNRKKEAEKLNRISILWHTMLNTF